MRDCCFNHFEHAGIRDLRAIGRNEVFSAHVFHLEEIAVGRAEADVVEWCHFVFVCGSLGIDDLPLGQLCNDLGAFFVLLVFLYSHFSIALKREEIAF